MGMPQSIIRIGAEGVIQTPVPNVQSHTGGEAIHVITRHQ